MINIDEYTEALNERLNKPVSAAFSGEQLYLMIESKRRSVFKKIKLILRIEILICTHEIISEAYYFTQFNDAWSKTYAILNILISGAFLVIFVRLIKKINDPLNRVLSLKENTQLLLNIMLRFYHNYFRFALYYAIVLFLYNVLGILLIDTRFDDGKEVMRLMQAIKDPFLRYCFLFGYEIIFSAILYLLSRWIIRLFYRKRIIQLKTLVDEMND